MIIPTEHCRELERVEKNVVVACYYIVFTDLPDILASFIHSLTNAIFHRVLMAVWLMPYCHIPLSCRTVHATCVSLIRPSSGIHYVVTCDTA